MTGTYAKLRDDSWGIRVEGKCKTGDVVTVELKKGGTKTEVVDKVIWQGKGHDGEDASLCTVKRAEPDSGDLFSGSN